MKWSEIFVFEKALRCRRRRGHKSRRILYGVSHVRRKVDCFHLRTVKSEVCSVFSPDVMSVLYRVTLVVADLGWVDYDFGHSTVCQVLLGQTGIWQNRLGNWAR